MTRLAIAAREDMPAQDQHYYDRILRTRGEVAGPFSVLLHTPDVAERIAFLGSFILHESILPGRVKYLVMLVTAQALDADYAWDAVLPHARRAGIPATVVDAVKAGQVPDGEDVDDEQRLIVRVCRKLLGGNHHIDEATYQGFVEHFGVPAAVQIAYTVGYVFMMSLLTNAFEVVHDPEQRELIL